MVCDSAGSMILQHSTNLQEMLRYSVEIVGQRLEDVVGGEAAHTLRNALATSDDPARPALRHALHLPSGPMVDVSLHRFNSRVILEFEPASTDADQPLEVARMLISRIRNVTSTDRLVEIATRLIYAMLGYDRVMVYRFEQDGAGKVISEYKRRDLESFKGQYFPAGDIPKQARALYIKNTIRVICDADYQPVPIIPVSAEEDPVDLSHSHLRSVSPVHCEYLRNMGVSASMSISIVVDGELQARRSLDRFLQEASHHRDISALLRNSVPVFADMLPCDGAGLWLDGSWSGYGTAPSAAQVAQLADEIGALASGRIWSTSQLSEALPNSAISPEDVCGVLAVPLSQRPRDYLFFFRKEVVRTLDWAGDPKKTYTSGPMGDRLTPRTSFALWKETVRLKAQPWTDNDREISEAIRAVLVEIVLHHNEILADERGKADVRQRMLNEELNHRVKNILSIIKALVGHPVEGGRTLTDYIGSLKGRIQALAFAHDQVVRGGEGGKLADLLDAELRPYMEGTRTITLDGPSLWLDSRAFSVMALVLHEMSTNAAKYGSLSKVGGKLDVRWSRLESGACELTWVEREGPKTSPPVRLGFGSVLISRSVPYELDGEARVDYAADGVRARFVIPGKHLHMNEEASQPAVKLSASEDDRDIAVTPFRDLAFLLVEDQMLIAADVETMLADRGVASVTTAPSVTDAMRKLKSFTPDVAILDVNLGSGTSLPIAEELVRRGVPFVFATGYSDRAIIPSHLSAPVVRKPYEADSLLACITRLLAEKSAAGTPG
eukprot:g19938.t1